MRVLIWTQYFWPEHFHINDVAQSLHKEGVEITVLTGKPNYPKGYFFEGYRSKGIQHEMYNGIQITRIPLIARKSSSPKDLVINYLSFVFSGYLCAPFALRKKKFDLIFVYAPSPILQALPAIFLSFLKKTKLVLWVQDIWPDVLKESGTIKNKPLLSIIRLMVSYIYKFSDLILIQSEKFRPSVEVLDRNKEKIHFHPNSSGEILKKEPSQARISELSKDISQNFSIIFAGNIGASQSCETIIEAADLLKNFENIKFYLVGEGRMAQFIAEEIRKRNLNHIIMTGAIPPHDMAHIYESASALLLTLRDDQGVSLTIPSRLQSYMAAGKPIIVSSNGASSDIIKDANAGISCPAGDAKTLAEAVLTLYKMPYEERNSLGKNGHTYFMRHFYLPQRTQDLIEHFKNLMKTKGY